MEDNPFTTFISQMREDMLQLIPVFYRLGEVRSISPLAVEVAGTIQDKDALLINGDITKLTPGDQVLLIPIEEEQRYIILCKVVSP